MAGLWRRVFGESAEPGGPGAGTQLWWQLPYAAMAVVRASGLLELLQLPELGRRYAWGIQARVVDAAGRHLGVAMAALVVDEGGAWQRSWASPGAALTLGAPEPIGDVELMITTEVDADGRMLTDIAVWTEIGLPPDDPPVVARWSALRCHLADGSTAPVPAVMVTFPTGSQWRRTDVQLDEVGVLQVSNTKRRTPNRTVLALPADQ